MKRSNRWSYHFRTQLECVYCRSDKATKLYDLTTGQVMDDADLSLDEWHARVPEIEVFCDSCGFRKTWKAKTEGRVARKHEVAQLADIIAGSSSMMAYYDPDKPQPPVVEKTVEDRFWAKVEKVAEDECWLWTGARDRDGFGLFRDEHGRLRPVHRFSYEWHVESLDPGQFVLHSCPNLHCVNPEHLFID